MALISKNTTQDPRAVSAGTRAGDADTSAARVASLREQRSGSCRGAASQIPTGERGAEWSCESSGALVKQTRSSPNQVIAGLD